ncbi:type 4 prepilin peptidase 1 [Serratia sp. FGI94]|uniref:prepilin peptidase n=1 Tax=Serratia sp. FGI94 TaxID=671990 RepID=UPI0002A72C0E|nr:A24 family peptidase [Serratia sp. FGI94]AGB84031.1 type 4 prepilin peptidase 1 [Serratia sp. FGI94]
MMSAETSVICWHIMAALLGASIGSFLNVVIYRIPLMIKNHDRKVINEYLGAHGVVKKDNGINDDAMSLIWPRSSCPACRRKIAFYDNIPMISWLVLGGRCRYCDGKISCRYPIIEMLMMLITLWLTWTPTLDLSWVFLLAFSAILIALAVIDYDHLILPDCLTGTLLWLGLLWHCLYHEVNLSHAVIGVVVGYLCFWLLCHTSKYIMGKDCLGYGDLKMLAGLGAWFGWQSLPDLILIAASVSILCLLFLTQGENSIREKQCPFGPGLALAGLVLMVWQNVG